MGCFHPREAWLDEDRQILWAETRDAVRAVLVPCGRCIGCTGRKALDWSVRCTHEASLHEFKSFVTLTYAPEFCPPGLVKSDLQSFFKRLRKRRGPFRYFACGEYGSESGRPHYHALLFGLPLDVPLLEKCWSRDGARLGFVSLGTVNPESIRYVAGYVQKKMVEDVEKLKRVDKTTGELVELAPEFRLMSLRPGIGGLWIHRFMDDVFSGEKYQVPLPGGRYVPAPRYYEKRLEARNPDLKELVDLRKSMRTPQQLEDMSASRRLVLEKCRLAKVNNRKGKL